MLFLVNQQTICVKTSRNTLFCKVNIATENADNGGGGYSLITYSLWTFMFLKN